MDVVVDLGSGGVHLAGVADLPHVAVQVVRPKGDPGTGAGAPDSLAAALQHHRAGSDLPAAWQVAS